MIYRLHLQNVVDGIYEKNWAFLPTTVLGRDPSCGLCIDHESISRKHCQFQYNSEGTLVVKDLESMNGTYVNDVRIQHRALMPGDVIQVGALRLEIVFSDEEMPVAAPTAPTVSTPQTRGSMYETQPMKKVDPLPPPPPKPWWRRILD
jgi:pSer/pThr/pTyr-binding forkhead associated (FHA) protein